ncbi:hypothetical protein RJ639_031367 [Escallonia herrerae]|uniref:Protein root UVB sensitive/RUS domain-containing protein n=1 Tax=Escallonia herrerae TaxID=1293975 RepID=A0AA88WZR0_9ASTE|nr:hypothetical protein RJ639_031367 [Escallonia herrerae]
MEVTRDGTTRVILEEWSGTSSSKLLKTATVVASPSSLSIRRSGGRFRRFSQRILEAFGFPSSVTPDYVPFQVWDSLQGLSTYIRTMLSTQSLWLLKLLQWFPRELTGMLGGVIFTFYQGSNLDSNAKMWRLVADFMNDLGMLMDLVSPLFPSAFVMIVCLGSLSRSFTGVASGATRAALTQHFALQNNAADISAKEGSQETLATMIGMALGMVLARVTMGNSVGIWFSFLSLTLFHIYANYKAVRCLSLVTLNCERSSILLHFMETGAVLSPKQVSVMEGVLPSWISAWSSENAKSLHKRVCLGVRISSLDGLEMADLLVSAGSYYEKGWDFEYFLLHEHSPNYQYLFWSVILFLLFVAKYLLLEKSGIISILVHKDSTARDVLQAFMHALVMANLVEKDRSVHLEGQLWMDKHYEHFVLKVLFSLSSA